MLILSCHRKIYTFFVDDNSIFCVISHIIALACNNKAFLFLNIISRTMFTLGVRPSLNCQPIQWHGDVKDQPLFRAFSNPGRRKDPELREALSYGKYQEWVKRLREEIGFVQVLTTYCLRRAARNAINDKPQKV